MVVEEPGTAADEQAEKRRTYKIYFIEFLLPLIAFIVTNVGRYSKKALSHEDSAFSVGATTSH